LDKDFKFFFVKYNDPIYVKLEKLDILYKLNDAKNFENIMAEMKNYAITEFDNDLVKKSIAYIGNIGLKFEKAVDLCVDHINEVMEHNQDFTVNYAIIVARDLLRKYKNKHKTKELIKKVNQNLLGYITEAESKSSFLYILGEFSAEISSSTSLIESFVENFTQETFVSVRLQILTATIKNYVNKPDETETLIMKVLQKGGEESENPDVRDRSYLYWRLLETEPDLAKDMIIGERPSFEFKEDILFESDLTTDIIENMTNVSGVYHRYSVDLVPKEDMVYDENAMPTSPTKFHLKAEKSPPRQIVSKNSKNNVKEQQSTNVNILGLDAIDEATQQQKQPSKTVNLMDDIFNLGSQPVNNQNNFGDFEFGSNRGNNNNFYDESQNLKIFEDDGVVTQTPNLCITSNVSGENGNSGIAIYTTFARESSRIIFGVYVRNYENTPINNIDISLNANSFGLTVANSPFNNMFMGGNSSQTFKLACDILNERNDKRAPTCPFSINGTFRSSLDTFIISCPILVNVFFSETGKMPNNSFSDFFKTNTGNKANVTYSTDEVKMNYLSDDGLFKLFERNNIFQVAKNNKADPPLTYYTLSVNNAISCIVQVSFRQSGLNLRIISNIDLIIPLVKEALDYILRK